jgi:uncharacterized protein
MPDVPNGARDRGPQNTVAVAALAVQTLTPAPTNAPTKAVTALPPSSEVLGPVTPPADKPIDVAVLTPPTPSVTQPLQLTPAKPTAPDNACIKEETVKRTPAFYFGDVVAVGSASIDPATFGRALSAAAREQLDDFTVYTDKYQSLKYPMGDLPAFYGVCTDVIVRAYRELGIDLQRLVHESKLGGGDTNIDHRRVTTLQKFFAKYGDALPITEFGEDYMPGDIVSYWRPQNAHSRTHIAIVSDVIGPSGQWMIIHNRGWGPQIEDGLFVDQITGHYRYTGANKPSVVPVATPAVVAGKPAKVRPSAIAAPALKAKRAEISDGINFGPTGSIRPPKLQ